MTHMSTDQREASIQRARRNTLGDLLSRSALRDPDKLAFIYKQRKITYQQLDNLVNQTAHGLINNGVKKGDRFALLSKNNLDFIIVMFRSEEHTSELQSR